MRTFVGVDVAIFDDDGPSVEGGELSRFPATFAPSHVLRHRGAVGHPQNVAREKLIDAGKVRK